MPELPEVETVVRGLRETVMGETIARVTVRAPLSTIAVSRTLCGRRSPHNAFAKALAGRTILDAHRRGKNILMALSGDITLWVHLKMTGHLFHLNRSQPIAKHDLVLFDFNSTRADSDKHLRFNDYRRFGRLRLYPNDELWQQPGLAGLGPEPLKISTDDFVALCHRRGRMIKPALLDQSFLAGLGNIYTDEALYASRIHPKRLTASVSKKKLVELHAHIQRLLKMAISMMGTSVDSYSGVNGQTGNFQKYLKAYGNEGLACERCGSVIVREKIGSRSAHYCPRCQRVR